MFDFIKNIGTTEMILIAVILLLIFGPKLIKTLGRASGETLREVKKVKKEFSEAVNITDKSDKN